MKLTVINIITSDYSGDPRKSFGYRWQDFENKIAGHDVIVERTDAGVDYVAAATEKMEELGIDDAYVTCMWCGGFSGSMQSGPHETKSVKVIAPLTMAEEQANQTILDGIDDDDHSNHPGWCDSCRSYCYGDCTASERSW